MTTEPNDTFKDITMLETSSLMLTTVDNPFSPKDEYAKWKRWDVENGHNTEEYIGRLIIMEEDYDIDDAFVMNMLSNKVINEILENDDLEIYRLV